MSRHLLPGDPPVEVVLRRSARARRISLRVSSIDGKVTLTCPPGVREAEALGFAEEKAGWLRSNLAKRPDEVEVRIGADLPVRGNLVRLVEGTGRGVQLRDGCAEISGNPARAGARLQGYLKELARAPLAEASDHYAAHVGPGTIQRLKPCAKTPLANGGSFFHPGRGG